MTLAKNYHFVQQKIAGTLQPMEHTSMTIHIRQITTQMNVLSSQLVINLNPNLNAWNYPLKEEAANLQDYNRGQHPSDVKIDQGVRPKGEEQRNQDGTRPGMKIKEFTYAMKHNITLVFKNSTNKRTKITTTGRVENRIS